MKTRYALIGTAGYIAPRHLKAIKETDGELTTAFDINDSVGILDSHFPNARFFTEFETFEQHLSDERRHGKAVEYISICSPNYLHKAHTGSALRNQTTAICEKPLVLDPSDIDDLVVLENETGKRVFSILQLRLQSSIIELKKRVDEGDPDKIYDVDLGYFTSRGSWYHASWKGQENKSGGIMTNIGVHLFDMLGYVFGSLKENIIQLRNEDAAAGYMEFSKARVRWILSINRDHLPPQTPSGQTTYRSVTINGEELEFSGGFTDLHTVSYQNILSGEGYGLEVVRPSIELVSESRTKTIQPNQGEKHPDFSKLVG